MNDVDLDAVYFAGFFDGEGCIAVALVDGRYHKVRISIGQTNEQVILDFQRFCGGTGTVTLKFGPTGKELYYYQLGGSTQAANALRRLVPYMRVKREEAELAIVLAERIAGSGYPRQQLTDEEIAERRKLADAINSITRWKARGIG